MEDVSQNVWWPGTSRGTTGTQECVWDVSVSARCSGSCSLSRSCFKTAVDSRAASQERHVPCPVPRLWLGGRPGCGLCLHVLPFAALPSGTSLCQPDIDVDGGVDTVGLSGGHTPCPVLKEPVAGTSRSIPEYNPPVKHPDLMLGGLERVPATAASVRVTPGDPFPP